MKRPALDRRLLENFSWGVFLSMIILIVCGLINLYSISEGPVNTTNWFVRQSQFVAGGLFLLFVLMFFDYRLLKHFAVVFYVIGLILLWMLRYFGGSGGGATRWLVLPYVRFQPSELMKIFLIIALAFFFSRKEYRDGLGFKEVILPLGLMAIPAAMILMQPDMGTAAHLVLSCLPMFVFVRLTKGVWITGIMIVVIFMGVMVFGGGYEFLLEKKVVNPYQISRLTSFMSPEKNPTGSGWQTIQAKSAIGSGQILGRGFRAGSQQKYGFLPAPETDFAFAALAEEWGFVGAVLVLALYLFMLWSAINVIRISNDRFGSFLALGLGSLLFSQMAINVAMVTGLFPVVGIPLPFISYGGTSVFISMTAVAVILNVGMRRFMFQDDPVKQNPKVWQEGATQPQPSSTQPVRRLGPMDPDEPENYPPHRLPHTRPWLRHLPRKKWLNE